MKLKKIHTELQRRLVELGFEQPSDLLKDSFGTVKSGRDAVIISEHSYPELEDIAIHAIQKADKAIMQSPRILIIAKDKETVIELFDTIENFGKYTSVRSYFVHDKSDLDEDKNLISVGIDVLIGTPNRLNEMFSSAGFDVNQLKLVMMYQLDALLKQRFDAILYRLSESIGKTQRVYFAHNGDEKMELFAERTMIDPVWFEENSEKE